MGKLLFDQYTYLHFAVGIVLYFWNVSLKKVIIYHSLFEFLENTELGIDFINNYFLIWPGGKPERNYLLNSIGDTIGIILGW